MLTDYGLLALGVNPPQRSPLNLQVLRMSIADIDASDCLLALLSSFTGAARNRRRSASFGCIIADSRSSTYNACRGLLVSCAGGCNDLNGCDGDGEVVAQQADRCAGTLVPVK